MLTTNRNESRRLGSRSRTGFVLVAGLMAFALLTGCIESDQTGTLAMVRSDRAHNRVRSIAMDGRGAVASAQSHAASMAVRRTLYHSVLRLGPGQCAVGENVGYGPSVGAVERAFMNSPRHRANILNPRFDHVGLGVVRSGGTVWVVQLFIDYC